MWHDIAPYALPPLVLAVFVWRALKAGPRKVRTGSMWIVPILILIGAASLLANSPWPGPLVLTGYAAGLVIGFLLGWLRARHMTMRVDPETGHVTSQATPIGIILVVGLFVVRYALKLIFPELAAQPHGHPAAAVLWWTDAALLFSCGIVWGRAVTTSLRVRRLRAAHAVGTG